MDDRTNRPHTVHKAPDGSEQVCWAILNSSIDGLILLNFQGSILQVNDTLCRMVGYSADELIGKNVGQLEARKDPSDMERHLQQVLDRGEDRFETVYRRRDGSSLDVEVSAQYRAGDLEEVICFVRDISERVHAEQALRQSEEEKRLILESISDVVAFYDSPELNIVWTNHGAGRTVDARSSELVGRKCHQIWADSAIPCADCPVLKAFRTGKKTRGEQTTPDGRIWSITAYPAFNEFGLLKGVVEVAREITQARLNQENLRKALDRITFLIGNSPLAVIEWDRGDRVASWSAQAETLFGWTEAEALGKNWRELGLVPEGALENVEAQVGEMFADGSERNTIRNPNRTKDGRIIHCVWHNSALKDERGRVIAILSQVEDVTAHMQAEEEKKQLELQVRQAQKLESVGRLAGGIAHDLNNLLSPILGYAEIVLADTSGNDPRYAATEQILGAGERARDLVHQLLAFSRKQTLQFVSVNLNDLLERFLRLLVRTIREDIDIRLELLPDLPAINADMGYLEQVIMNLAVNAQDAMPDGGVLVLKTDLVTSEEKDESGLQGVSPGRYVLLEVRDTGEGMARSVQDHIFEPFFTTKRQGKGTGLGLATVYGIVNQHGGSIRVRSEPGQGTSFFIFFPVHDQGEEASGGNGPQPSRTSVAPTHAQKTVLLVEDNEQVRSLVESILTREGFRLLVARDGLAGRELYAGHQGEVDLLLTDVIMPGMNGRELYEELVNLQPGLKAIFMSGYTDDVIGPHGMLEKGTLFLQKPFSILTLKNMVHAVLDDTKAVAVRT